MTVVFLMHSVLLPMAFLVRFLLLAPLALLWPRFHDWMVTHASSLAMNAAYRRQNSADLTAKIKRGEIAILLFWLGAFAALRHYHLAWKAIAGLVCDQRVYQRLQYTAGARSASL